MERSVGPTNPSKGDGMSAITSATVPEWHAEAISLREQGMSEREIAEAVGRAPSSVHEVVKDVQPRGADEPDPERLAQIAGDSSGAPTPGQQTIDGGEVSPEAEPVGEVRIDGLKQLGLIDFGGKKPQSSTLALTGGQFELEGAYEKGDRLFFAGQAQVEFLGALDKIDRKTMIPTTAVQQHKARIFELVTGDEEQVLVGMFRALVRADRQKAAALADAFVREANGGV
jgi:hypothetical protein